MFTLLISYLMNQVAVQCSDDFWEMIKGLELDVKEGYSPEEEMMRRFAFPMPPYTRFDLYFQSVFEHLSNANFVMIYRIKENEIDGWRERIKRRWEDKQVDFRGAWDGNKYHTAFINPTPRLADVDQRLSVFALGEDNWKLDGMWQQRPHFIICMFRQFMGQGDDKVHFFAVEERVDDPVLNLYDIMEIPTSKPAEYRGTKILSTDLTIESIHEIHTKSIKKLEKRHEEEISALQSKLKESQSTNDESEKHHKEEESALQSKPKESESMLPQWLSFAWAGWSQSSAVSTHQEPQCGALVKQPMTPCAPYQLVSTTTDKLGMPLMTPVEVQGFPDLKMYFIYDQSTRKVTLQSGPEEDSQSFECGKVASSWEECSERMGAQWDLQKQLIASKTAMKEMEAMNVALLDEQQGWKEKTNALEIRLQEAQQEIDGHLATQQRLELENGRNQERVQSLRQKVQEKEGIIHNLNLVTAKSLGDAQKETDDLRKSLFSQLISRDRKFDELEVTKRRELQQKQQEIEQLVLERDEYNHQLSELMVERDEMGGRLESKKRDLEQQIRENDLQKDKLYHLKDAKQRANSELVVTNEEITKIREKLAKQKEAMDGLHHEIERLESDKEDAVNAKQQLQLVLLDKERNLKKIIGKRDGMEFRYNETNKNNSYLTATAITIGLVLGIAVIVLTILLLLRIKKDNKGEFWNWGSLPSYWPFNIYKKNRIGSDKVVQIEEKTDPLDRDQDSEPRSSDAGSVTESGSGSAHTTPRSDSSWLGMCQTRYDEFGLVLTWREFEERKKSKNKQSARETRRDDTEALEVKEDSDTDVVIELHESKASEEIELEEESRGNDIVEEEPEQEASAPMKEKSMSAEPVEEKMTCY